MELNGQYFSFEELCYATAMSSQTVKEIINHGIIEPVGSDPDNWRFSMQMVSISKKAYRLHRDLEIDWSGIALAISLLEELEQLRDENRHLRKRLERFLSD